MPFDYVKEAPVVSLPNYHRRSKTSKRSSLDVQLLEVMLEMMVISMRIFRLEA